MYKYFFQLSRDSAPLARDLKISYPVWHKKIELLSRCITALFNCIVISFKTKG